MATKITWENKEGIQNDESIPRKNKVMDDDMNEIKQAVNNNADELNEAQENINNLQDGQGTANADITNLKGRVTTLETDNTQNKSDINTLKSDNETNKSNIQQLQNKQQETETNVGTLQGKVNTLETDNTQNKENIENLQEDNVQNKADISTLKLDNESNKTNISTLQENVSNLDTNKVDKVEGKGLSSNDFTNEYKQKLDNLENYNDTEIKEEIESLKSDNTTNKSNIENLQENDATQNELISKLKSALINVETEEAKSLHIEDASEVPAQLKVMGNQEQDGEPSPENEVEVKCLGSNKNLFNIENDIEFEGKYRTARDGTILVNNDYNGIKVSVEENTNYIISFEKDRSLISNLCFLDKDGVFISGKSYSSGETLFTTPLNCKYISLAVGKTIEKLKLEEGEIETSYSPYEQGSTEIKKINKNFLISKEIDTTINGVKIVCNNGVVTLDGKATGSVSFDFDVFSLKKGIYKNTRGVVSGKATGSFQNYLRNEDGSYFIQGDESFELQEEKKLKYRFFANPNSVFEKYTMIPQVEKGLVSTTPETHKEKSKILPIQQEMLEGDYFVKEADGWKEVHNWNKRILTGDESYNNNVNYINIGRFGIYLSLAAEPGSITNPNAISNYYKSEFAVENGNIYVSGVDGVVYMINENFKGDLEGFKQQLRLYYQENKAVYIYYVLQTPTKLPCTEEQSAVLDELNNLNLFDGVNNIITAENIAKLKLKYVADTKTYVDKEISDIKEQINTINELLSTTGTSSLLLDNLQSDLESEVM